MASQREDRRGEVVVWVAATVLGLAGMAIGVAVATGNDDYYDGAIEPLVVALGWMALLGAPAVLAILALRGRPVLLLPAAVILVPLSFLSFAGILLPLLILAILLFRTYRRRRPMAEPPRMPAAVTTVIVVVLLVGAAMALFVHPDPREYETATVSGGTTDVVSGWEGLTMIVLSGAAVAVGWRLAEPEPRQAAVPSGRKTA